MCLIFIEKATALYRNIFGAKVSKPLVSVFGGRVFGGRVFGGRVFGGCVFGECVFGDCVFGKPLSYPA